MFCVRLDCHKALNHISPEGRIRTFEGKTQEIYSLSPLATWVPLVSTNYNLKFWKSDKMFL